MPAKVEISRETLAMSAAAADAGGQDSAPCYATSFKTSGEWVPAPAFLATQTAGARTFDVLLGPWPDLASKGVPLRACTGEP